MISVQFRGPHRGGKHNKSVHEAHDVMGGGKPKLSNSQKRRQQRQRKADREWQEFILNQRTEHTVNQMLSQVLGQAEQAEQGPVQELEVRFGALHFVSSPDGDAPPAFPGAPQMDLERVTTWRAFPTASQRRMTDLEWAMPWNV